MAEVNSYKCDICGRMKEENNHWFKGFLLNQGLRVVGKDTGTVGLMIVPWDTTHFDTLGAPKPLPKADAHLCGHEHAMQWASKNLKG